MSTDENQTVLPPITLGGRVGRGLVYVFAGSTAAKLIGILSQIILLYFLQRSDFGVVTLAYTIMVFIQVLDQTGLVDVLIRRRRFRLWAISGFWLALALGVFSSLLILLCAPIAAAIYGRGQAERDQLFWVLVVLAPSSLLNALAIVPRAKLSRELRFRALAGINLANITLQKILAVALAALGLGPYSLAVPWPVAAGITSAIFWWWARPPFALRPQLGRWRYMIGDSTRLYVAEFGRALLDQSDYVLLGLFRTVEFVGIYTVGFLFSIQTLQLLMTNLTNTLFPAFTILNDDPNRQSQGFLKAQRILATLAVSSCLLQAAIAEPFAHLVFPERWEPSIIVMQILSLGMATRMVAGASFALLKSQGRFRAILWNRWGFVILQVFGLLFVLQLGGNLAAVAATVAVVASLIGPVTFYTAIRPYGAGWRQVAEVLLPPLLCGIASVGPAWLIARAMAAAGYGYLPQLVETVLVAVAVNALLARLYMRPVWDDFWFRVRRLAPHRAEMTGNLGSPARRL